MEESESGVNLQELSNDDQDEAKKKKSPWQDANKRNSY